MTTMYEGKKIYRASTDILGNLQGKPEKALALAILNKAREDAENGDLSALTFLLLDGLRLEELILNDAGFDSRNPSDNYRSPILEFVKRTWQKLEEDQNSTFFDDNALAKEIRLLRLEIKNENATAHTTQYKFVTEP